MKKTLMMTMLFAIPLVATADDLVATPPSGFYLGAGLGSVDFEDDDLSRDLAYDVGFPGAVSTEAEDTAIKLFAGYRFNKIASIEASFTQYGDVDYAIFSHKFMTLEIQSVSVAANLGYSFDSGWRPFALIGLSYVSVDLNSSVEPSLSDSESYTGVHYGFGVEYSPASIRNIAFRLALEGDMFVDNSFEDVYSPYYDDEYAFDVTAFYAGVSYTF